MGLFILSHLLIYRIMPEVCCVQSFGVAVMKGLDPSHLQLEVVESLLPLPLKTLHLPESLLSSIGSGFGLYTAKASTRGWKFISWLSYVASCF